MTYGLIFWRNSSDSCKIFRMQKRVIRIIMEHRIKKLKTLPLGLLLFVVNNKEKYMVNSETYSINARQSINLHLPHTNLAIHQKGVSSLGIKIFNSLPSDIKNFSNNKKIFKKPQKFYIQFFYLLHEHFYV
jgi:hypothetical protein